MIDSIIKGVIAVSVTGLLLWWFLFGPYSLETMPVNCVASFNPIIANPGRVLMLFAVPIGSMAGLCLVGLIAGKFVRVDKHFEEIEAKTK